MALFGIGATAPCPYCYERIDPRKPDFRCTGRPAPGKEACAKAEDPVRKAKLNDVTPVFPAFTPSGRLRSSSSSECPHCLGPTGIRICPECHSVLPANFTADSPMIGIVGVRGSGKTVMLTVLAKELTSSVARRFDANIDSVGTSSLLTQLDQWRRGLESGTGELPQQTAASGDKVPAVFEWQIERPLVAGLSRTVSTVLSFYDTAGESLATTDTAREQHYLAASDGLILLLDPFGFPENRETALQRGVDPNSLSDTPRAVLHAVTDMLRETERLKANQKIKKPVAVVLAKIDAFFDEVGPDDPIRQPATNEPWFDEAESLDLHHHVESIVSQWGGDDVLAMLRFNFESYRFFVASALGAEPNYQERRVNSRGLLPHRVAEPLLWLMSERGFIPIVD